MKTNKILYKMVLFLLIILIVMFNSCYCYATNLENSPGENSSTEDGSNSDSDPDPDPNPAPGENTLTNNSGGSDLPNLGDFKPSLSGTGSRTKGIINTILGLLTTLGVVTVTVSIALLGFSSILGSASEKAVAQERYMGVIFAAIFLTAGSAIAKMLISFAQSI